eukprot:12306559-Alexandrium_andersonii.AAC.1
MLATALRRWRRGPTRSTQPAPKGCTPPAPTASRTTSATMGSPPPTPTCSRTASATTGSPPPTST